MAQALGEDLVQTSELQDDSSSLGSDSELSGPGPYRQADRYGFIGGSSAEPGPGHPPADLIRQREMKWVEMTSHWEKTMSRRYKKVKMQCRKGIPSALRARCWPLLCGAHVCQKNSPDTYKELAKAPGDPHWMETISRDLHRQFPLHEMQQGLLQVLKAYTLHRPEQGYCQAQGPVAAVLLMHLPPEEAFWCLVQICEVYLPGYYGPHMEAVQLDAEVFAALLRRLLPRVHKHLQQVGVGPLLYLPEWFLCLFARSLPFPTVLRVWDAFLSEGVKVLFRVGLTLVRLALGTTEQRLACPGLLETLGALRAIPPTQLQEEVFMSQVHSVALSERDLQREIRAQLAQLPQSTSGPPPRPQARLPGAQAIFEAQQLAGARGGARPEVPRIVVQPPEEPRPPRRKPQTRGKTFHGLLTRSRALLLRAPPGLIEAPPPSWIPDSEGLTSEVPWTRRPLTPSARLPDACPTNGHRTLPPGFGKSAPFPQTVSDTRVKEGHAVWFQGPRPAVLPRSRPGAGPLQEWNLKDCGVKGSWLGEGPPRGSWGGLE